MEREIAITEYSSQYELIDSGDGEKLERYGNVVLSRPDPQAIWPKTLSETEWQKAEAVYKHQGTKGKWVLKSSEEKWKLTFFDLTFNLQLLPSKHLGVFPEQSHHWQWLEKKISERSSNKKIKVLNLFGYTGGSSLACAKAGAEVCHVDASKFAVDLAMKNLDDSGLKDKPVRFIVDDVRKFVEREIKRGNKYDVIILDPPVYGKGAKKEVWRIESDLLPLLKRLEKVLTENSLAIILNGYSSGYSAITYAQLLKSATEKLGGKIYYGDLTIKESKTEKLLPSGIFARWER